MIDLEVVRKLEEQLRADDRPMGLLTSVVVPCARLGLAADALRDLRVEVESLSKRPLLTFDHIGAARLADEVDVLVRRKIIDSRSPAADALCDYRDPPTSPRSDRMVDAERERDAALARVKELEVVVARFAERLVQLRVR
jgi:hypothetical protein